MHMVGASTSNTRESDLMRLTVNGNAVDMPASATVADVVTLLQPARPFAVAVNLVFVPSNMHDTHSLQDDDQVELITPVTGG